MHKRMLLCTVLALSLFSRAQEPKPVPDAKAATADQTSAQYSGMYSFLREGEIVQLTVEDAGHVTGFISRYSDRESDRGAFLDHFFKDGKLDGNKLNFTTRTVHGVWFEFLGTVEQDQSKKPGEEGYFILKGTLTENASDETKKATSRSREVALKSFPQDAGQQ